MKIKFKKKRNYINLSLGIFWILLGVISFIEDDSIRWTDYGYLLVGTLYVSQYLWDITNQYLTVENDFIKKNTPLGKKIKLSEINSIKKFTGDYTLKTATEDLKINTELIDEKSLTELNRILTELNLSADKTPFVKNIN